MQANTILFKVIITFIVISIALSTSISSAAGIKYQVVGSTDYKQTTTRGPCFSNRKDANKEKKSMEKKYRGGKLTFWIENVCRDPAEPEDDESAFDEKAFKCITVTGYEVRTGMLATINNSCPSKVRVMVGGVRFTIGPMSTLQGRIVDHIMKSEVSFVD